RGAQAIATSATLADWLFLSYITPLVPGDEDYAISLVMPMNAEGLRLYPRRPYATAATSVFDYPLSSRFDEIDTTVVFNDVFVPWEQVFIYRSVDLVNAQFHETPAHTTANFQSLVRFGVKLEFMAGLALRLAEVQTAEGDPSVQATLGGEIAALCAAFDALVQAAERSPLISVGVARPHPQYVYAGMALQRRLIVDMMRTLRELAGGAFQTVPSSEAAFTSEETRANTERYYRSAAAAARERIKLVKLVWDFVGTEFGGRQLQYEMFYSAAQPPRVRGAGRRPGESEGGVATLGRRVRRSLPTTWTDGEPRPREHRRAGDRHPRVAAARRRRDPGRARPDRRARRRVEDRRRGSGRGRGLPGHDRHPRTHRLSLPRGARRLHAPAEDRGLPRLVRPRRHHVGRL